METTQNIFTDTQLQHIHIMQLELVEKAYTRYWAGEISVNLLLTAVTVFNMQLHLMV